MATFGTSEPRTMLTLFGPSTTPHLFADMSIALATNATGRWYEGSGDVRQIDGSGRTINFVDGSGGVRQIDGSGRTLNLVDGSGGMRQVEGGQ